MSASELQLTSRIHFADLVGDLETLVSCESPSDDLAALDRSARTIAEVGARILGVEPEILRRNGVPHVAWNFGPAEHTVLLLGHHDTVWTDGSWAGPVWASDGVTASGPGIFDMKAGLVQMLHAVAALDDRRGIRILITGDEEVGSAASHELITELAVQSGVVLVFEASAAGGALKTERSGVAQYEVRAHGRAAHAGLEPESGVNASIELAKLILKVSQLDALSPDATVTPSLISGGDTANTVPALATLTVDVRSRTSDAYRLVDASLAALTPDHPEARVEVRRLFATPPLESSATAALFELAASVARELGQPELRSASVGGASDGNRAGAAGALVLDGFGAVGGGAHALSEHIRLDELVPRTVLIAAVISAIQGGRLYEGGGE